MINPLSAVGGNAALSSLATSALSLAAQSLNPKCSPSLTLSGASALRVNAPGQPFSAAVSCPVLEPTSLHVFLDGRPAHGVRVAPSSGGSGGSEILFPHGLDGSSAVSIIASDTEGYPFTATFSLTVAAGADPDGPPSMMMKAFADVEDVEAAAACFSKNPTLPIYQHNCQDPPPHQCTFYSSCIEASVPCRDSPYSYAMGRGTANCHKFRRNIHLFTDRGKDFVWNTMSCMEKSLVPVVSAGCKADDQGVDMCQRISEAASDSHAKCYVASGFCGLECSDYLADFVTIGLDLFTSDTAKLALEIAGGCLRNITSIIQEGSCMAETLKEIVLRALGLLHGSGLSIEEEGHGEL